MDWDTLIAVAGALGLREAAGQVLGIWQGRHKRKLDEAEALWEENRKLRAELDQFRGATEVRISQLEKELEEQRGRACPWGRVDCPRERKPVAAGKGE